MDSVKITAYSTNEDGGFVEQCPANGIDCPYLDELKELRRSVEKFKRLALTDPLTGLANRRHFKRELLREIDRTKRNGRPLSLIMADLDHFKMVNDAWGHHAGDIALSKTAEMIRSNVRKSDLVCRYGGEEFIILLPESGLVQAVEIAERIRSTIYNSPVKYNGNDIRLSASLGAAEFDKHLFKNSRDFIDFVDGYLFLAKRLGRNRVCHPELEKISAGTALNSMEKEALGDFFNLPER